jgi:hypothetical protein
MADAKLPGSGSPDGLLLSRLVLQFVGKLKAIGNMLADSCESIKTVQALLGHSDIETTLNTYAHAIPGSQRRAVEQVAGVLFSNVLNLGENAQNGKN